MNVAILVRGQTAPIAKVVMDVPHVGDSVQVNGSVFNVSGVRYFVNGPNVFAGVIVDPVAGDSAHFEALSR